MCITWLITYIYIYVDTCTTYTHMYAPSEAILHSKNLYMFVYINMSLVRQIIGQKYQWEKIKKKKKKYQWRITIEPCSSRYHHLRMERSIVHQLIVLFIQTAFDILLFIPNKRLWRSSHCLLRLGCFN